MVDRSNEKLLESEVMESGFQDTKIVEKDDTDAIFESPYESVSAWEEAAVAAKDLYTRQTQPPQQENEVLTYEETPTKLN